MKTRLLLLLLSRSVFEIPRTCRVDFQIAWRIVKLSRRNLSDIICSLLKFNPCLFSWMFNITWNYVRQNVQRCPKKFSFTQVSQNTLENVYLRNSCSCSLFYRLQLVETQGRQDKKMLCVAHRNHGGCPGHPGRNTHSIWCYPFKSICFARIGSGDSHINSWHVINKIVTRRSL